MIAVIDHQPFTLPTFKRKLIQHPRLYLKDESYVKRSSVVFTKLGMLSIAASIMTSLGLLAFVNLVIN